MHSLNPPAEAPTKAFGSIILKIYSKQTHFHRKPQSSRESKWSCQHINAAKQRWVQWEAGFVLKIPHTIVFQRDVGYQNKYGLQLTVNTNSIQTARGEKVNKGEVKVKKTFKPDKEIWSWTKDLSKWNLKTELNWNKSTSKHYILVNFIFSRVPCEAFVKTNFR